MQLPEELLSSLEGTEGFSKENFQGVHDAAEQITSIRVNPGRFAHHPGMPHSYPFEFELGEQVPWSQFGYYLPGRPSFTFDPLFHAGCYYVQEASSMFIEQALTQHADLLMPLKVLDLCAAPGGKSTHLQSLISADSLLVSNEVIRARCNILKDNCIKWGGDNVVVSNNDPRDFSRLPGYFDVIVIDAPCSGSGLFRRSEDATEEWSINNVALCSQRQQRILADAWPALREGGIIIYSTCSFSKQEDEDILDWLTTQFPVTSCAIEIDERWGIVESVDRKKNYGYRFWPDRLKGEGFFLGCFRKEEPADTDNARTKNKTLPTTKKETEIVRQWCQGDRHTFLQKNNLVYAIPAMLEPDVQKLLNALHVQYSGVLVGEIFHDQLAPHHALAMSHFRSDQLASTDLDMEAAIQYLQRKDFHVPSQHKGWVCATYKGYALGWMKMLTNRINNYYPKELRILKEHSPKN